MRTNLLEFLAWTFYLGPLVKSNSNSKGFQELCSFAEDNGYQKAGETDKGVIYKNGNDQLVIPFPEGYAPLNKK